MLGIDRNDLAGAGSLGQATGPPMISDSLFARARVDPASSAANVGRNPAAPAMPLRTTSQAGGQIGDGIVPPGS